MAPNHAASSHHSLPTMSVPDSHPHALQIRQMTSLFFSLIKDDYPLTDYFPASSPTPGAPAWELAATQVVPFVQVYKLAGTDFCFKIIADIEATPETAFDLMADITRRPEWDDMCENAGIVQEIDSRTKIQFMTTKAIWPTSSRDSLTLSYISRLPVPASKASPRGPSPFYVEVNQSIDSPLYPPRDTQGVVRMTAKIAGQIIGPTPDGRPGWCRIVQVADGDLKGWIPSSVVGYIATKAVPGSFVKLQATLRNEIVRNVSSMIEHAEAGSNGKAESREDGEVEIASETESSTSSLSSDDEDEEDDRSLRGRRRRRHHDVASLPSSKSATPPAEPTLIPTLHEAPAVVSAPRIPSYPPQHLIHTPLAQRAVSQTTTTALSRTLRVIWAVVRNMREIAAWMEPLIVVWLLLERGRTVGWVWEIVLNWWSRKQGK